MKNKHRRFQVISEILRSNVVGSQDEILELLAEQGHKVTQATLSRDMKQLKVVKTPLPNGMYKYILPPINQQAFIETNSKNNFYNGAIRSLDFSGELAVIKTKPGYASAIAWDIDNEAKREVVGTIAGDDTILLVLREGVTRDEIIKVLNIAVFE